VSAAGRETERLPATARSRTVYVPALALAVLGISLVAAMLTGYNPDCSCPQGDVCSCPAQTGPPIGLAGLGLLAASGAVGAATFVVRRNRRTTPRV
jgi:hypothetical protein